MARSIVKFGDAPATEPGRRRGSPRSVAHRFNNSVQRLAIAWVLRRLAAYGEAQRGASRKSVDQACHDAFDMVVNIVESHGRSVIQT